MNRWLWNGLTLLIACFVAYFLGSIHGIQEGAQDATNGYRECMHLPDGEMYCWLTEKGKQHRSRYRQPAIKGTTQ